MADEANLDPTNRSAAISFRLLYSIALAVARVTVKHEPDLSKGYIQLGAAHFCLGEYDDAVSAYKKGLEIDPNNEDLKFGLADAQSAASQSKSALPQPSPLALPGIIKPKPPTFIAVSDLKRMKRRGTRAKYKVVSVPGREVQQRVKELTGVKESMEFTGESMQGAAPAGMEFESSPEQLKYLFLYCSLFPLGYEFRKDELVRLWIAEGFISERQLERMEDTGSVYFNSLVEMGFIVPLSSGVGVDFDSYISDDKLLYKANEAKASDLKLTSYADKYLSVLDGKLDDNDDYASERTQHLSLLVKDVDDQTAFEALKEFKNLRTLHLFHGCGSSSVKQVPLDLFLSLTLLRTLNLSRTLILELPSSIGNVKSLRYLDVSYTRIKRLPESIDSLYNLQTLKLRGCLDFVGLPKGTNKLTNLRHLELDIVRQLISMPTGIGKLTNLQTLLAFLVGRDNGFRIGEIKDMNNLSGAFCISRLENILNFEEAKEAALIDKKYLGKIELQWSDSRVEKAKEEEEILDCLVPHYGLRELQILFYGGLKLPSWISDPSFAELVAITLYKCRNCRLLPSLGKLPSLKFLCIREMNGVKEIGHQFCRNDTGQENHAFAKLEKLEINVMLDLEEWTGVQDGDLPALLRLRVEYCPKLSVLPLLSCLNSLKHLEIIHCPMLLSLPNEGLPTSLEFLMIKDCPELRECCRKGEGQDWVKIENVPRIWIDHQDISSS